MTIFILYGIQVVFTWSHLSFKPFAHSFIYSIITYQVPTMDVLGTRDTTVNTESHFLHVGCSWAGHERITSEPKIPTAVSTRNVTYRVWAGLDFTSSQRSGMSAGKEHVQWPHWESVCVVRYESLKKACGARARKSGRQVRKTQDGRPSLYSLLLEFRDGETTSDREQQRTASQMLLEGM